ncbi:MAG: carboxypeptidase regulatory-like domain-containing protein [Vicinamibacterales bacterium]
MRASIVSIVATCLSIFCFTVPPAALAQPAPQGILQVTVVDSTGAVLVGATVTVAGIDANNKGVTPPPAQTSAQGVAAIPRLVPGRYSVQAEFGGFETRKIPEVRVRNGDNKQVVILQVEGHKEAVVVEQDRQRAAADPRGPSFGMTLTREQLEALSDDPQVLRQQLQDMAGPGAVISVDSFEGGALPPKAQIRSIRISRDQFAAEHHSAGGIQIEIITQPGLGPIRMNLGTRLRGGGLSGRNPFTGITSPEQLNSLFLGGGGTLIKNKSSFNLFVNANSQYETPNLNVALTSGTVSQPLPIRSPRDNVSVFGSVDYALTLDQTLRFGFNTNHTNNRNQGIGLFDEIERAYSTLSDNGSIRVQQIGPIGRRAFTRSRLQFSWSDSDSTSAVEAPTIRVNDAFTRGGAQIAGGQHSRTFTFGSDLDYVRGIHTWRTGILFDGGRWRSNDTSNYLGTYTFESLEAFVAGRPRSYTRRIGDPNLRYQNLQGAIYLQDDARVRRNLTVSAGVRYEAQTHMRDFNNLMPRFGITWAPFAAGQTTLRSSWGLFHDWLQTNTYEQTLRVDGFRQRELDLVNPPFPDLLGFVGTAPPVNRYLLGSDFALPRNSRVSLGLDQRLASRIQSSATYSYTRGSALAHGDNLNAPAGGVRPDPSFGNIVEVVADANSRLHQVQFNITANPGALFPVANAPLINLKRTTLFFNYTWASLESNTDGAFSLSPSGFVIDEWGPSPGDIRHRLNVSLNNQIVRGLGIGINVNRTSAPPYSIRTGRDDNGDLVFNDRPAGVGRNTERGTGQFSLNLSFGYSFAFGKTPGNAPPGIAVFAGGGTPTVQTFDMGPRYRLGFFVNIQNATNHDNYVGYIGTLTSPFFGRPTNVAGTRKVDLGFNLGF